MERNTGVELIFCILAIISELSPLQNLKDNYYFQSMPNPEKTILRLTIFYTNRTFQI